MESHRFLRQTLKVAGAAPGSDLYTCNLSSMIQAVAEMIKKANLDQELIEIDSNQAAIEVQKERQAKVRSEVKQFWKN